MRTSATPRRLLAISLLLTLCVLPLLSHSGGTQAAWHASATGAALPDAVTDSIGMTVSDVTLPVDNAATYDVFSDPGIKVTNTSTKNRLWVDVVSTTLSDATPTLDNPLLSLTAFDYDVTTNADCTSGLNANDVYWDVGGSAVGAETYGTYPRTSTPVSGDHIGPNSFKTLCPWFRLDMASGTQEQQALIIERLAGRAVDVTTKVRLRTEAPATWATSTATLTTRYQVAAPPPTPALYSQFPTCKTDGFGFGIIYWSWPATHSQSYDGEVFNDSAAIAEWVIRRKDPTTGVWADWYPDWYTIAPNKRRSTILNSLDINGDDSKWSWSPGADVQFMVRGYLNGDHSAWINAGFIVTARDKGDSFECRGVSTNTETGADAPGLGFE